MKLTLKKAFIRSYTSFLKNMVKEMKIKSNKKLKFNPASLPPPSIPTIAYFQVIGNGVKGSPKCVHLFTNFNRYLFNVGEGTQRLVIEHKCKLSKLSGIFITHSSWDNMGGLPGVMLCLKDIGINKVVLHGPPKVENLFIMTKGFMQTEQIEIEKYDYTRRTYEDGCIKIHYVPMIKDSDDPAKLVVVANPQPNQTNFTPSSTSSSDTDSGSEVNGHLTDAAPEPLKDIQESVGHKAKPGKERKAKFFKPGGRDIIISYIGELYAKPGALDYQKCMDFKVPPNSRLLGNLKAGQDAILDDGTVVKSMDVVGPEEAALHFAVVECPSMEYIANFTTNESLARFHLDAIDANKMKLIVHFTPRQVMETSLYKNWMAEFGPSTSHLVVNESNHGDLSFIDALEFQAKLNLLDPDIYPLGLLAHPPDPNSSDRPLEQGLNHDCGPIYPGKTLAKFHLRPACDTPYDITDVKPFRGVKFSSQNIRDPFYNDDQPSSTNANDESSLKELKERDFMAIVSDTNPDINTAFAEQRNTLRSTIEGLRSSLPEPSNNSCSRYPQFIFLGTGSAVPNKTRNVSAIWLSLEPDTSIMLDCGEGTFGQVARFFGLLQAPEPRHEGLLLDHMLRSLKCVFISHLHADHHLGLISIINERRLAFQRNPMAPNGGDEKRRKLILVGPKGLATFLKPYNYKHQEIMSEFEFIHSYRLMPETHDPQAFQMLQTHLGIEEFIAVPVYHFKNPTGLVLGHKGRRVVYSGDTLPCDNLIKYGHSCDVLIHEATMEDDLESEGFKKRHSTISQALDVGKRMNAKFTLLTHFSQRYSKIPLINENHEAFATLKNAGIAFDNMKVDMENMSFLPYFLPVLKTLFADETLEMEERTTKLINRKRMAVE